MSSGFLAWVCGGTLRDGTAVRWGASQRRWRRFMLNADTWASAIMEAAAEIDGVVVCGGASVSGVASGSCGSNCLQCAKRGVEDVGRTWMMRARRRSRAPSSPGSPGRSSGAKTYMTVARTDGRTRAPPQRRRRRHTSSRLLRSATVCRVPGHAPNGGRDAGMIGVESEAATRTTGSRE